MGQNFTLHFIFKSSLWCSCCRFYLHPFFRYMPGGYRKPRKDKRKPEKFTGAQGTDVGKSETFDYSGKLAASREAAGKQASPEPQAPASGPRAQQKVQKNANKGKKKGGKSQGQHQQRVTWHPHHHIDVRRNHAAESGTEHRGAERHQYNGPPS